MEASIKIEEQNIDNQLTAANKNLAALLHLSTFTQYFIPFGNYVIPIILWNIGKKESSFVDFHGKQTLNFQLSIFLYTLLLAIIAVPIFFFTLLKNLDFNAVINNEQTFEITDWDFSNISGLVLVAATSILLFIFLKLAEFFLVIYAAVKAANGEQYTYPLSIKFFK
ncbi:DUF4870 domain-containing protein [Flavobacterium kingsejongi]|uniref:DUF4870 domain-containing protein n=1 Tax=Flavobacterium kingsejongi TaxID=1678728 RepID=A0A2S1LT59_9FLAO|nr:DUF4870 domain-containing protein [Flavobacterium kingsejongi]AWG26919.1 hypothetical protein FK004_17615 [Flavobacterium kingsejongi]